MKLQETTDILTEEDEKLLRFIQSVKNNIKQLIGIEKLIDEMRSIINNSNHFSFRSKRNEKLISLSRPLFVLKFDPENIEFDDFTDSEYAKTVFIQRLVQKEITSVFSEYLSSQIRDAEGLKRIMKIHGIDSLKHEELMMVSFITSSIFGINIDLNTNLVYLEYVV